MRDWAHIGRLQLAAVVVDEVADELVCVAAIALDELVNKAWNLEFLRLVAAVDVVDTVAQRRRPIVHAWALADRLERRAMQRHFF
jgi:hypothetical protein